MSGTKLAIAGLVLALVASNGWWAYHTLDRGITVTYLGVALDDNKTALAQTLAILPVVARGEASRDAVIAVATTTEASFEPFEKDGFVWVGRIGLKFDERGRFVEATRGWDPP